MPQKTLFPAPGKAVPAAVVAPVANIASTVLASVTPQLAAIQNQLVQPGRGGADPMKAAAQLEQTITALNSVISK